jgi:hypothetical protein
MNRKTGRWRFIDMQIAIACGDGMPRSARASVGALWYHALYRGSRREAVFHKPCDYDAFVDAVSVGWSALTSRCLPQISIECGTRYLEGGRTEASPGTGRQQLASGSRQACGREGARAREHLSKSSRKSATCPFSRFTTKALCPRFPVQGDENGVGRAQARRTVASG